MSQEEAQIVPEPDNPQEEAPAAAAPEEETAEDINTSDFLVPDLDQVNGEFEVAPALEEGAPEEGKKETVDGKAETIDLSFEANDADAVSRGTAAEEDEEEEKGLKKKTADAEELEENFFEKVVDEDAEKKKVVSEIAGMSEVVVEEPADDKDSVSHLELDMMQPESSRMEPSGVRSKESPVEIVKLEGPDQRLKVVRSSRKSIHGDSSLRSTSHKSAVAFDKSAKEAAAESEFATDDEQRLSRTDRQAKSFNYSMTYIQGPRVRNMSEDDFLSGFDTGGDIPFLFDEIEEEEEAKVVVEEEELPSLDRQPYYERHDKAAKELEVRKMRNLILNKKLAMYFKRKKMDYVTKESPELSTDIQIKGYFRKVQAYGELKEYVAIQKERITQDLEDTKRERNAKYEELTSMFKRMQDREGEIGYGLINTKTGNAVPDKLVERLIRRQNNQMQQVSSMRLTYINLKGMVQEKLDAIAALDEVAPGFLLADYEQLKIDNRSYADKIEERDEELARLRARCAASIQILAHLREKSSALANDLEDLLDARSAVDAYCFFVRSKLNSLKTERDSYRNQINNLRDEWGLLTYPTLLRDMESELSEVQVLTEGQDHVLKEHKKRAKQIKNIRKKIEITKEMRRNAVKKPSSRVLKGLPKEESQKQMVYRGRPTLIMPTIAEDVFDGLKTIKPKLTYDRRRHQGKKKGG